jgi:hypothetical protein
VRNTTSRFWKYARAAPRLRLREKINARFSPYAKQVVKTPPQVEKSTNSNNNVHLFKQTTVLIDASACDDPPRSGKISCKFAILARQGKVEARQ